MKTPLFAVAAIVAAAVTSSWAASPQCWQNGVAVPCAAPPGAAESASQPTYTPPPRKYPPSWYYDPYNEPWYHCKLNCGW